MSPTRVLIVSSHGLFREGLTRLLADIGDVEILDRVDSLEKVGDLVGNGEVDVVIMEQAEGINHHTSRSEAIGYMLALPDVRVISVSLDTDDIRVYRQERVVEASLEDLVAVLRD